MDCLNVLYGDAYDFFFMFDHRSGHEKKRFNGLDGEKKNVKQGGILQHPTLIKMKDSYLGPYYDPTNRRMVKVGEYQRLI